MKTELAFPSNEDSLENPNPGMTLRDYFAAKAMQELVGNQGLYGCIDTSLKISQNAYQIADAMLKERSK